MGAAGRIPPHADSDGPPRIAAKEHTDAEAQRQPEAGTRSSVPARLAQHRPAGSAVPARRARGVPGPARRQRRRTEEEAAPRREPVKGSAGACGARAQAGPSPSSRRRTMRAAGLLWAALWALLLPLVRTRGRAAGPALADGAACRFSSLPAGGLRLPALTPGTFQGARRPRAGPAQVPSPAAGLGWAPPASEPLGAGWAAVWPGGFGPPGRALGEASRFPPLGPGSSGRASSGHALGVAITNLMSACVDKAGV